MNKIVGMVLLCMGLGCSSLFAQSNADSDCKDRMLGEKYRIPSYENLKRAVALNDGMPSVFRCNYPDVTIKQIVNKSKSNAELQFLNGIFEAQWEKYKIEYGTLNGLRESKIEIVPHDIKNQVTVFLLKSEK